MPEEKVLDDKAYMQMALEEARVAALSGEVPVGAVIVNEQGLLAKAHNEVQQAANATRHAELLAIERACFKLKSPFLNGCRLYVTLEPCPMCLGAILLSRLDAIFFAAADPKMGAAGSVFDISQHPDLPRAVKVYSALCESESREMLQEFFKSLRE